MPLWGGGNWWQTMRQVAERFRILDGLQALHRVYSFKQRFATVKLIGFNMVKVYKPIAALVTLCSATYGYREWYKARKSLQITSDSTEAEINAIFDRLDRDHNGEIDSEELRDALDKAGMDISLFEVELMMRTADENSDGRISKSEWIKICQKLSNNKSNGPLFDNEEDEEIVPENGENSGKR
jgi:hypothetical protein